MNNSLLVGALLLAIGLSGGVIIGIRLGRARATDSVDPIGAVTAVLGPAADALQRVESELHRVERERAGSYAGLHEQVAALHRSSAELGQQTRSLVGALRAPTVRGRWGEVQLQRIVELAGMVQHCDFDTQTSFAGGGDDPAAAGARPDMVIRLAGGRHIPVDAKVPFQAWLAALDTDDERHRAAAMREHARALRAHVDALAAKAYWRHFQPAPEFVVMFVPGEPLLDAAMTQDPSLTEYAFSRQVVIATPSTLIALLRTIAFTWRAERLSTSAEQVHALGRELHGRLVVLSEHLGRVGSNLQRSVESYNSAIRSYESRVLVSARRFTDLGAATDPLEQPDQVDTAARTVAEPVRDLPLRRSG
ncbi:DNA recombination protein RmuC [Nakamurella lactea]|uniref:DNA recombination protein RmuC n=1 Tax=Nakamurella lactea TaxID=459515 RepID=UPI00042932F3|nr:DNA recombination protein RmuC [Nakamurella lactea]